MQWIKRRNSCSPEDMDVLLYITTYHEDDLKEECESNVIIGFISSDDGIYYSDIPNGSRIKVESEITKVIAWALIDRIPNYVRKWIKN